MERDPAEDKSVIPQLGERAEIRRLEDALCTFVSYRPPGKPLVTYELTEGSTLTIGRTVANDIALVWDPEVSEVHARLEELAPGVWAIVDDGISTNGTRINGGARIHGRRRLFNGDLILVGSSPIVFRAPSRPRRTKRRADYEIKLADRTAEALRELARPIVEAQGLPAVPASNQQIAQRMGIGVAAVRDHIKLLNRAFAVEQDAPVSEKRLTVVMRAIDAGLVPLGVYED